MNESINIGLGKELKKYIYENNIAILPVTPTFSLYDKTGTAIIEDDACTIGSDNALEYDLLAAQLSDLDPDVNFKIVWRFTYQGVEKEIGDLVDLVIITWDASEWHADDLFAKAPYLRSLVDGIRGKAQSGTTGTIVDDSLVSKEKFSFKGSEVKIYKGTNEGKLRKITAFTGSTLSVDPVYPVAIDSTSQFWIGKSYIEEMEQASLDVQLDLDGMGIPPQRLIDGNQVKNLVMLRAAQDICFSMINEPEDVWQFRYNELKKKYDGALTSGSLKVDNNQDGNISDSESAIVNVPRAVR